MVGPAEVFTDNTKRLYGRGDPTIELSSRRELAQQVQSDMSNMMASAFFNMSFGDFQRHVASATVEMVSEKVPERAAEKVVGEVLVNEVDLAERVPEVQELGEGLVEVVERIRVVTKHGVSEQLRTTVKMQTEVIQAMGEKAQRLQEALKKAEKEKDGVEKISEGVREALKGEKSPQGEEADRLLAELKGLERGEALDKAADFADRWRRRTGMASDLDSLLKDWERLSLPEARKRIDDIVKGWEEKTSSYERALSELRKLESVPDAFLKRAETLFAGDALTLEGIRRAHNGAAIEFIREQLVAAVRKEETEFWQKALAEAQKARSASVEEFNKRMEQLLRGRKELGALRKRAVGGVIGFLVQVIAEMVSNPFIKKLRSLLKMKLEKGEMKGVLEKISDQLRRIQQWAEKIFLAEGDEDKLKAVADEIGKETGMLTKAAEACIQGKKTKGSASLMGGSKRAPEIAQVLARTSRAIWKAIEKGDTAGLDSMCASVLRAFDALETVTAEQKSAEKAPPAERKERMTKLLSRIMAEAAAEKKGAA